MNSQIIPLEDEKEEFFLPSDSMTTLDEVQNDNQEGASNEAEYSVKLAKVHSVELNKKELIFTWLNPFC